MQARGLPNYRLKYCWPKVIYSYCICQPHELARDIKKKTGEAMAYPGPPFESPLRTSQLPHTKHCHKNHCCDNIAHSP